MKRETSFFTCWATESLRILSFFAVIIAFLIWLKTKDRTFTFGGFLAVFLHSFLDYTTSAKMRPFYPFSANESALRAIYPFDPVVNVIPLLPLFIVAAEYMKKTKHKDY
nr:metal-dependent hydrolase [Methanosarcina horonobensis]